MSAKHSGERMVVVPYRPGEAIRKRLFSWLAVVLTACVFSVLGYYYADVRTLQLAEQNQALQQQLMLANQRATEAANKAIAMEQEKAIDLVAKKQSQEMLRDLQNSVQKLTRDLTFYKGIMSSNAANSGLQISQLEIRPARAPGHYPFKLVLAQISDHASAISGKVILKVVGLQKGKSVELGNLNAPSDLSFSFKYFQDIEGELTLPDNLVPGQIKIQIQANGKKGTKLERVFNWEIGA
ncbi:MAG: hypothetical protein IPM37_05055 [Hahellaceae bacterium]|nr:hypothetical protein [Hahellaceae bacterium]